jgi:hypothetical protein
MDNASGMDVFKCSEYLVDQELNVIIAKSLDFKNIGKICAHQDGNKISGKRQKMAMDMIHKCWTYTSLKDFGSRSGVNTSYRSITFS